MTAAEYLDRADVPAPDDTAPEAEWGFAGSLGEAVRRWAQPAGHPVVEVRFEHPQHPAAAVAGTMRDWLRRRGEPAERLLVSSFIVHDPWRTLTSGSVPFWTFFPVEEAASDLAAYLDTATYDDVDVMLFSHGVRSRGLADARTWQQLADRARRRGRMLGTDPSAFPADFTVFARYTRAMRSLPDATTPWRPMSVEEAIAGLTADSRLRVQRWAPA